MTDDNYVDEEGFTCTCHSMLEIVLAQHQDDEK